MRRNGCMNKLPNWEFEVAGDSKNQTFVEIFFVTEDSLSTLQSNRKLAIFKIKGTAWYVDYKLFSYSVYLEVKVKYINKD